jgi:glyoxylase-like metal-dependent hydrolase (beta-lactamase superfamily II)
MSQVLFISIGAMLLATVLSMPAQAQQRPQIETNKVDGTDNVYIFRNGNHQSMFVVTKDGVIATDPIAYGRPNGGQQYVDEIKKVTEHLAPLKDPNTPLPDQTIGDKRVIKLGDTSVELLYLGPNHSDSNLVIRLPKEKIVFIVDTIPVGSFPGRGMIDFFPLETETFITKVLALDWDRLIPGHPGQPNGRLGTKDDAKNVLALYQEASAEMKKMGQAGKCWDEAEKEFKLPKYESMPGYANGLPFVARRYCALWGRGT